MINSLTGEVMIGSPPIKFGPGFNRSDLPSLPITSQAQIVNEPYHSYFLEKQLIGGEAFWVTLHFYQQKLESISLENSAEELGTSWNNWSEGQQLKRKQALDAWLIREIGSASQVYDWGEIGSAYDPKSGGSSITIRYSWQGNPWPRQQAT